MTQAASVTKLVYEGNSATYLWPYTFTIKDATDILVYITAPDEDPALIQTSYSVDTENNQVRYPTADSGLALLPEGSTITLIRLTPLSQELALTNQGAFSKSAVEAEFDKLTRIVQEHAEAISRSVKFAVDETPSETDTIEYLEDIQVAEAAAAQSEANALSYKNSAAASSGAAATSATAAAASQASSTTSAAAAVAANVSAAASAAEALASKGSAASSETAAGNSATAAAASATSSASSATSATASKNAAATSATAAAASATAAATSATAAAASATAAATSATAAAASATAAAASSLQALVLATGTPSAPQSIIAGTGIVLASTRVRQLWYVKGTGGVDVSANPQIAAGNAEGDELEVRGTSDTDTVLLEHGTGLVLNGSCLLSQHSSLTLSWNATNALWVEKHRNDI